MSQPLYNLISRIDNAKLRDCVRELFNEHSLQTFSVCPASTRFHHEYEGGLLEHTLEVTRYAMHQAEVFPEVDRDVLLASCLLHDYMKTAEYAKNAEGKYERTQYANEIGHIAGVAAVFQSVSSNVPGELVNRITHCLLSHHGRKEWGSPVEPQSLEALILHGADMLSAKFGHTKAAPLPVVDDGQEELPFHVEIPQVDIVDRSVARTWLETLPEPYRALALANLPEHSKDSECSSLARAIFDSFGWASTPEGADFWMEVYSFYAYGTTDLPSVPAKVG